MELLDKGAYGKIYAHPNHEDRVLKSPYRPQEYENLMLCQGPNVIKCYGIEEIDGTKYMVMHRMGESLSDFRKRSYLNDHFAKSCYYQILTGIKHINSKALFIETSSRPILWLTERVT